MTGLERVRGTTVGWIASAMFSLIGIAFLPAEVEAVCNYGWCGGGDPAACGGYQQCTVHDLQNMYYDGGDCWGMGETCYQYICWYRMYGDGHTCQVEDTCDNSDVWTCYPQS